jgi:hypothetical protein
VLQTAKQQDQFEILRENIFLFDLLVEIFVVVVVISMSKIEKSLLNVLAY